MRPKEKRVNKTIYFVCRLIIIIIISIHKSLNEGKDSFYFIVKICLSIHKTIIEIFINYLSIKNWKLNSNHKNVWIKNWLGGPIMLACYYYYYYYF